MKSHQAVSLFRELAKTFYPQATVVFANQSRQPKAKGPLIMLTPGNVKRPNNPNNEIIDGTVVSNYASSISVTIDLFTNGTAIYNDNMNFICNEDTAVDDLNCFMNFICSNYVVTWCDSHDLSVLINGDIQHLSGIVNDTSYEFRSRVVVNIYFTEKTVGSTAIYDDVSIRYPTGEVDADGNKVYSKDVPVETESVSNGADTEVDKIVKQATVDKEEIIDVPGIGGINDKLADDEIGYFTEAEIKEQEEN